MKKRRKLILVVFICLFTLVLPTTVYADMGPKDKLKVYVKNPPKEQYYLDLLTQDENRYNYIKDDERAILNAHMISLLYICETDGWKPALVEGTMMPMHGKLIGKPY